MQRDEENKPAFIVGEDISNEPNSEQSTLNTEAVDRGNDRQVDVAGDNANIVGDGDAMTAGNSGDPTPDDDAVRRMGRETSKRG
jgi:hypothetical protein